MANKNEYRIIVSMESGDGAAGAGTDGAGNSDKSDGTSFTQKSLAGYFATKMALPLIKNTVDYYTTRVEMLTGSGHMQDKIDYTKQIVGDVMNIGKATFAGAVAFGPVGAAVGALVGAVGVGISYANRIRDFNYNASVEAVNVRYMEQRQGFAFNRSRQN